MNPLDKFKQSFSKHKINDDLSYVDSINSEVELRANKACGLYMVACNSLILIPLLIRALKPDLISFSDVMIYAGVTGIISLVASLLSVDSVFNKITSYYNKKLGFNFHRLQLIEKLKKIEVQKDIINYFNNLGEKYSNIHSYNNSLKLAFQEEDYDNVLFYIKKIIEIIETNETIVIEHNDSTYIKIELFEKMIGVDKKEKEIELEHTNLKSLL